MGSAVIDISNVSLETERLVIRSFRATDVNDFYDYAKVDGVGQMAGWTPHKDIEESKTILEAFVSGKHTFALVDKTNDKVIGSLGIEGIRKGFEEFESMVGVEIGFVLAKDYWGHGLMPEAVNRVVRYLFDDVKVDYILCSYYIDNDRSRRVQEKCGFKPLKIIDSVHKAYHYETKVCYNIQYKN